MARPRPRAKGAKVFICYSYMAYEGIISGFHVFAEESDAQAWVKEHSQHSEVVKFAYEEVEVK